MLQPLTDVLANATGAQALAAFLALGAFMGILWTRSGLALLTAAFVIALAYATAAGLRESFEILPFLPAVIGIPLCIRLLLHPDRPRVPRLAWIWIALATTFGFRSAMSDAGAAA